MKAGSRRCVSPARARRRRHPQRDRVLHDGGRSWSTAPRAPSGWTVTAPQLDQARRPADLIGFVARQMPTRGGVWRPAIGTRVATFHHDWCPRGTRTPVRRTPATGRGSCADRSVRSVRHASPVAHRVKRSMVAGSNSRHSNSRRIRTCAPGLRRAGRPRDRRRPLVSYLRFFLAFRISGDLLWAVVRSTRHSTRSVLSGGVRDSRARRCRGPRSGKLIPRFGPTSWTSMRESASRASMHGWRLLETLEAVSARRSTPATGNASSDSSWRPPASRLPVPRGR